MLAVSWELTISMNRLRRRDFISGLPSDSLYSRFTSSLDIRMLLMKDSFWKAKSATATTMNASDT